MIRRYVRYLDTSLIDGFPKGVVSNVEFTSDFGPAVAFLEELLSLLKDVLPEDISSSSGSRTTSIECV
jgi:hypothetical protein